jgi:cold shock CspA family protein
VIGHVTFFDRTKRYGFIAPEGDGEKVFFHESALLWGECGPGQEVEFELLPMTPVPRAMAVRPLEVRA